jgi:hypothetical protein
LPVSSADEEAVYFDCFISRDVGISVWVVDMSAGRADIGSHIILVFIFDMGKEVAEEIVEKAVQVVAQVDPAAIHAGFITEVLLCVAVPVIVFIILVLVEEPESDIQVIDRPQGDFGGHGNSGDASELKTKVSSYRHPPPEIIGLLG